MGRKRKITEEVAEDILEGVASGDPERTVTALCRKHNVTGRAFYLLMQNDRELMRQFVAARQAGAAAMMDKCLQIADDSTCTPGDRKVRIYTRMKLAAKSDPAAWGEKLQLAGAEGLPPLQLSEVERAVRVKALLAKANALNGDGDSLARQADSERIKLLDS